MVVLTMWKQSDMHSIATLVSHLLSCDLCKPSSALRALVKCTVYVVNKCKYSSINVNIHLCVFNYFFVLLSRSICYGCIAVAVMFSLNNVTYGIMVVQLTLHETLM